MFPRFLSSKASPEVCHTSRNGYVKTLYYSRWSGLSRKISVNARMLKGNGSTDGRPQYDSIKLRSKDLSFHRFHPRIAFFPVVGTGRIDVARGLVSESVVSSVGALNRSHIKGPNAAIASVHSSSLEIFAKPCAVGTARLFEFHRLQSTSANLELSLANTRAVGKSLIMKLSVVPFPQHEWSEFDLSQHHKYETPETGGLPSHTTWEHDFRLSYIRSSPLLVLMAHVTLVFELHCINILRFSIFNGL
ncbi:hypothetical protein AVEN_218929-1 [Araneus ventricosus]|uniref:Uncharacterized protein n=1 Tax=Araneus ventricosus TaxID=182803 RepID=A0A4Y2H2D0_ARAVE|nr:hypothetical protein AVEN_218929-1 [Araneus ventricosus]